jgi:hypothetical protein
MNIKTDGLKAMMSKIDGKTMGAHALIGGATGAVGMMGYNAYTDQDHSIMGGALMGAVGGAGFKPAKNALTKGTANGTDVKVGLGNYDTTITGKAKMTMNNRRLDAEALQNGGSARVDMNGKRNPKLAPDWAEQKVQNGLSQADREDIARNDARYAAMQERRRVKGYSPVTNVDQLYAPFNHLGAQESNARMANMSERVKNLLGQRPDRGDPAIRKNTINYSPTNIANDTRGSSISTQNIPHPNSIDFVSALANTSSSAPITQGTKLGIESAAAQNYRLGYNKNFGTY